MSSSDGVPAVVPITGPEKSVMRPSTEDAFEYGAKVPASIDHLRSTA